MYEGEKVYDPMTNTWSTGLWIPMYHRNGHIIGWYPVWRNAIRREKCVNIARCAEGS